MSAMPFQLTLFAKADGPLTKRIMLVGDKLKTDASNCAMARGRAWRQECDDIDELATLIEAFEPHHALSLGSLRPDLPDQVEITTKRRLNGNANAGVIARTAEAIVFEAGKAALALLDYDTGGMPPDVAEQIRRLGGFEAALLSVMPELEHAARLSRASTSAGLWRSDTRQRIRGSNGRHVLVLIADGADSQRFLGDLHNRCWLAGLGWLVVSAAGVLLERSIVDRMVGSPERLVFEGPAILVEPLRQDAKARRPVVTHGEPLDTQAACPPLTRHEQLELERLKGEARRILAPEAARVRAAWIEKNAENLSERTGISAGEARRIVEQQCHGTLLPDVELAFDDRELEGTTVADVLADPSKYEGETLSDPLEGVAYGRGKAMVMIGASGEPWIRSFAHGLSTYMLRHDVRSVRARIEAADAETVIDAFIKCALQSDLSPAEIDQIVRRTSEISGASRRAITATLKQARQEQRQRRRAARQSRAEAKGEQPLPRIVVTDGAIARMVDETQEALIAADLPIFVRGGGLVEPIVQQRKATHGRTVAVTVFMPLDRGKLRYLLNKHAATFLRYTELQELVETDPPCKVLDDLLALKRWDFPAILGIVGAPTLRPDGSVLDKPGFDAATGLWCASDLELPPIPDAPTRGVAEAALELLKELLSGFPFEADVDRAVALAAIMTAVLRGAFDVAPLMLIVAHDVGSGKSYLADLVATIVTGRICPVISASTNVEEMEKRLGSVLLEGGTAISLDNISFDLESDLLCQILTQPTVKIRVLGRSQIPECEWRGVMLATGNNIRVVGDLVRRTLVAQLDAKVERPELREFAFDPIGRVLDDRGAYIAAAITIARAWRAAGMPKDDARPLGGYGAWSDAVRHPLIWLDQPDPVDCMEQTRSDDPERAAATELLRHWQLAIGVGAQVRVREVMAKADETRPGSQALQWPEFRALLVERSGVKGEPNAVRLGKWLEKIHGRIYGGNRIDIVKKPGAVNRYVLSQGEGST